MIGKVKRWCFALTSNRESYQQLQRCPIFEIDANNIVAILLPYVDDKTILYLGRSCKRFYKAIERNKQYKKKLIGTYEHVFEAIDHNHKNLYKYLNPPREWPREKWKRAITYDSVKVVMIVYQTLMPPQYYYDEMLQLAFEKDCLSVLKYLYKRWPQYFEVHRRFIFCYCLSPYIEGKISLKTTKWLYSIYGNSIFTSLFINYACESGNIKVVRFIYSKGIQITDCDILKVAEQSFEKVEFLHLKCGVPWISSEFDYFVQTSNLQIIQRLIEYGCPWTKKTFNIAVKRGNLEIVECLYINECPYEKNALEYADPNNSKLVTWMLRRKFQCSESKMQKIKKCQTLAQINNDAFVDALLQHVDLDKEYFRSIFESEIDREKITKES
jgi:hypothetical protein